MLPILRKRALYFSFIAYVGLFLSFTTLVNAHESFEKDRVIIHVNEDGFEPNILTVEVGTEVIFENIGKSEHWPASDDHPNHTLFDGTSMEEHCGRDTITFDSCGGIYSGEVWSFVFEKVGRHDYHDHLWPHLGGTIIVEEVRKNIFTRIIDVFMKFFEKFRKDSDEKLVTNLSDGNSTNEFYLKLKERYKNTTLDNDPKYAIRTLEEESLKDERVYALCHDILHEIGRTAYVKYGSFSGATKFQSDFCNSGYIHGVFETYFESVEDPLTGLKEQCLEYASATGRAFDLWQCYHGSGHGFMYFTGGDLDKSLALCEEGFGETLGVHCQNGAFMEIFNLEILAKEKDFVNPDDPFIVCSERKSKNECYPYIAVYFYHTQKVPFPDIFEKCSKAEFGYRDLCVFGIGSEAMKRNMSNPDAVAALCENARLKKDAESCISGAATMVMLNGGGSDSVGLNFCEKVSTERQDVCRGSVEETKKFFDEFLHFGAN